MAGWTVSTDGSLTGTRGDTAHIVILMKSGGTPADLTGCTVKAQVRSAPNGYIVFSFTPDLTHLSTGYIYLDATAAVTAAVKVTEAYWDVQLTYPNGTVSTIIGPAAVLIDKDITL